MPDADPSPPRSRGISRRRLLTGAAGTAAALAGARLGAGTAQAYVPPPFVCPHPNPIVDENRCSVLATHSSDFQLSKYVYGVVNGFATRTSVDKGQPVELKLDLPADEFDPLSTLKVEVFRLGYYEGKGGRLVHTSAVITRDARQPDPVGAAAFSQFGLRSHANWATTYTIPGSATAVSGMYLAKVTGTYKDYPPGQPPVPREEECHVPFVVRDDDRPRDLLVLIPTNTWQAYNYSTAKSLYTYNSNYDTNSATNFVVPTSGTRRATKVSFDRPFNNWVGDYNWVLRTEYPLIHWLERQGYDLAYTDDVALHFDGEQARRPTTRTLVLAGHAEYWTKEMRDHVEAARDSGTNVASFSANAGYWQVRYETAAGAPATSMANARTLVCYKTVEGTGAADPSGNGTNDPVSPTTTFRDPGAAAGSTGAPPGGRTGVGRPENGLFGVYYTGDDDTMPRGLHVPAGNGAGEFAAHRAWRNCGIPSGGATIGTELLGWEWDSVPGGGTQPIPPKFQAVAASQPANVQRMAATDPLASPPPGAQTAFLLDEGRYYSRDSLGTGNPPAPPPWQAREAHAVTYVAPSGALVFAAGTLHWSWGLAPHFQHRNTNTYRDAPVDSSDRRIRQATYNILSDGGVQPQTPEGIALDPDPPPPPPEKEVVIVEVPAPQPPPRDTTPPPVSPPDRTGPAIRIATARVRLTPDGRVRVKVTCAADDPRGAEGTIALVTHDPVRVPGRPRARPRRIVLGRAAFQVLAGRSLVVDVRVAPRLRRLVRTRGLAVDVTVKAQDPSRNRTTATRKILVRPAAGPGKQG